MSRSGDGRPPVGVGHAHFDSVLSAPLVNRRTWASPVDKVSFASATMDTFL
jgi:hypothetical protein